MERLWGMNTIENRHLLLSFLAAAALLAGCAGPADESAAEPEAVGSTESALSAAFSLRARHSGKCLDFDGASLLTFQATCDSTASQRFRRDGALVRSEARPDSCLDIRGASMNDGAPLQVYPCNGGTNEQIEFRTATVNGAFEPTSYYLVMRHSNKCVDVENASLANGADVNQFSCHGATNQQWVVVY